MATHGAADVSKLVLVGAMGIKPPEGEILDRAVSYIEYARAGFHDQEAFDRVYGAEPSTDQLEKWDISREMSFRIAWKPYMYSQTLPHLLGGVKAPALVVWGDDDRVVPRAPASVTPKALPNARLEIGRSAAAIASTWSSRTRSPGCVIDFIGLRSRRHAPDVLHRAADVGVPAKRPAATSAPRR